MVRRSNVLLPLYMYPSPEAWDPLYKAISLYPNVNFTVILNPNYGPGFSAFPDANYSRAIPMLNSIPNVNTLGYVRINYCKRSMQDVLLDVAKYAGWSASPTKGLGVHGIFVDETPNEYSAINATYLDAVTQAVKESPGILDDRMVIHNPGTPVAARLANPGPDVTAVVEESYANYYGNVWLREELEKLVYNHTRCAFMVHSVPPNDIQSLTSELRTRGDYVFVTERKDNFYSAFGSSWFDFVSAMATEIERVEGIEGTEGTEGMDDPDEPDDPDDPDDPD